MPSGSGIIFLIKNEKYWVETNFLLIIDNIEEFVSTFTFILF